MLFSSSCRIFTQSYPNDFLFLCGRFSRFSSVQPIYVNLIRDPLARLVSSYYFRRFGDYRGDRRTWTFKGTDAEKNMVRVNVMKKFSNLRLKMLLKNKELHKMVLNLVVCLFRGTR